MNILLIKLTSLGDVIHSTLALDAVKARFPQARITFVVDRSCALAVSGHPLVDRLVVADLRAQKANLRSFRLGAAWSELRRVVAELRRDTFDLAIDLQGAERSVLLLYLAKAARKFCKGRYPFVTGFRRKEAHALDELRQLLALAGIPAEDAFPRLALPEEAGRELAARLPEALRPALASRRLVCISPFTSWVTKDVPLATWIEACSAIQRLRPDLDYALVATPDKKAEIAAALEAAPELLRPRLFNLAGATTVPELARLVEASALVMASEGATGHFASALGTPLVVVFGPTSPSRVGPWGRSRVVRSASASCLECYRRRCSQWICMDGLADPIARAALELLGPGE
ncbi:MAG: hypothetical protein RL095_2065 [Verrucomicrobiota bacterium]